MCSGTGEIFMFGQSEMLAYQQSRRMGGEAEKRNPQRHHKQGGKK